MRIITNGDINSLLIFAKKNMGIYRLVYRKEKKAYWMMVMLAFFSLACIVLYASLVVAGNDAFAKFVFIFAVASSLSVLCLCYRIEKITHSAHMQIQNKRLVLLKRYYRKEGFSREDILIINDQLSGRLKKINEQRLTLSVVFGAMALPLWEILVEYLLDRFTSQKLVGTLVVTIIAAVVVTIIAKLMNVSTYLYEENFYVKNNLSIIENLIFLNKYIVKEYPYGRG